MALARRGRDGGPDEGMMSVARSHMRPLGPEERRRFLHDDAAVPIKPQ